MWFKHGLPIKQINKIYPMKYKHGFLVLHLFISLLLWYKWFIYPYSGVASLKPMQPRNEIQKNKNIVYTTLDILYMGWRPLLPIDIYIYIYIFDNLMGNWKANNY